MVGYVELRVRENGEDILVYMFKTVGEAAEMLHYLDGMLPGASFIVQPLLH